MAGPAIRAWHMAEVLASDHNVRLLSTASTTRVSDRFTISYVSPETIENEYRWADVVIIHPSILRTHPKLSQSAAPIVVDVYDPFHLENLEGTSEGHDGRAAVVAHLNSVINDALRRGDFFLCASDRQRDFWLGSLTTLGRINPATYDEDPSLQSLVAIAPFGIAEAPPEERRRVLRGVLPGVGADDPILLWAGGVYNWLDPVTLIDAVASARSRCPDLRLVFLGMTHPNPELPAMGAAAEARARSDVLGLTGSHVFFNEGWVPYDERGDYLLEADVGISTHRAHIETAFSFRTRMLDYLWAGLPIITSEGDLFAELAVSERIGEAVPPGDSQALADAIVRIFSDSAWRNECANNARRVAERFHWPAALEPLSAFCASPARAADLLLSERHEALATEPAPPPTPEPPVPLLRRVRRRFSR